MTVRFPRIVFQRIRSLFCGDSADAALRREISWHLEKLVQENISEGMNPAEARLAAHRALGNTTLIEEECRDQRGLNWAIDLHRDFTYAWRVLRKSPGSTTAAALALALGVGASIAAFLVGEALLFRSLPYPEAERLVLISSVHERRGEAGVGQEDFRDWQASNSVFERMTFTEFSQSTLTGLAEPERIVGRSVGPGFFELLRVSPVLGRWFSPAEQQPGADRVVMLSHRLWLRKFNGRTDVVGNGLMLNGSAYRITGVMPGDFRFNEGYTVEYWTPIAYRSYGRQQHQYAAYGRLAKGVALAAAQQQMTQIARGLEKAYPQTNGGWGVRVRSMRAALTEELGPALLLLWIAVTIVLLVACGNVASLLLARGVSRAKEIAIRIAIGGSRRRVLRLLLAESLLLSGLGTAAGLVFAAWLIRTATLAAPTWWELASAISFDAAAVVFVVCVALLTGLLTGAWPALRGARTGVEQVLKESGQPLGGGRGQERALNTLVIAEVALAVVLLSFAGLFVKSFAGLLRTGLGFPTGRLLTFRMSPPGSRYPDGKARLRFAETLVAELSSIPGVVSAAAADAIPLGGADSGTDAEIEGRPDSRDWADRTAGNRGVTPDYFRTLGVAIRAGRSFSAADSADAEPVAIVNEAFIRKFLPAENPLGRRLRLGGGRWRRIVGVAGDFRHSGPVSPVLPETYAPLAQSPRPGFVVLRTALPEQQLIGAVRAKIRGVDRELVIGQVRSMSEAVAESTALPRQMAAFLSGFALIAVAMATLGLAGVLVYAVSRRTREFGLRIALGARPADISGEVLQRAGRLILLGSAIGATVALSAGRLLGSLLYGVRPNDPLVFALAPLALAAAALVACLMPAHRAASVEPAAALRQE